MGHEVLAASPSSSVNNMTGEGLAKAVTGATVVVDVSLIKQSVKGIDLGLLLSWAVGISLKTDFKC